MVLASSVEQDALYALSMNLFDMVFGQEPHGRTTSLRSIETTSPVSGSTKSSTQVLSTRARLAAYGFLQVRLVDLHLFGQTENFDDVLIAFQADGTQQSV